MTDTRIPARTPDGEDHHVIYEGPRNLISDIPTFENLPDAGDGNEWALVHRKVGEG